MPCSVDKCTFSHDDPNLFNDQQIKLMCIGLETSQASRQQRARNRRGGGPGGPGGPNLAPQYTGEQNAQWEQQQARRAKAKAARPCPICNSKEHKVRGCPHNPYADAKCIRCGALGHVADCCHANLVNWRLQDIPPGSKDMPKGLKKIIYRPPPAVPGTTDGAVGAAAAQAQAAPPPPQPNPGLPQIQVGSMMTR